MKTILIFVAIPFMLSCMEENITNNYGPEDWQPPVLEWQYQPDAEVRGTIGIDIDITDSNDVEFARLYIDGSPATELTAAPYRFEITTDSLDDGVHILEVRAEDAYGNFGISPILRINIANSVAQGPQLIWVPDDYALIQAAINASTDFDTIRVRDGVYYETLNLFGKGIWLESENGPMGCTVDANGASRVFWIAPSSVSSTIRGFYITGGDAQVSLDQANLNFFNNIVISTTAWTHFITSYSGGKIQNNLFQGSNASLQLSTHWGSVFCNIIQYASQFAMWNASLFENPVEYGYNLFWENGQNYNDRFNPGVGDVYADPLINLEGGYLEEGSPAINAGNPEILDQDGTRSDIGPFGGPYAYN